jgi:predicted nucleic acid-binding protein
LVSTRRILIDTGPIVALLRRHDAQHDLCDALAKQLPLPALTCWPVISTVFTIDRRHFGVFRTARGDGLQIVPDVP